MRPASALFSSIDHDSTSAPAGILSFTYKFNVIAQELTYYGVDIDGKQHIAELIERMADIPGVEWIRLMKVKEESEKAGLKFNIQKTKIMASGPITS